MRIKHFLDQMPRKKGTNGFRRRLKITAKGGKVSLRRKRKGGSRRGPRR